MKTTRFINTETVVETRLTRWEVANAIAQSLPVSDQLPGSPELILDTRDVNEVVLRQVHREFKSANE